MAFRNRATMMLCSGIGVLLLCGSITGCVTLGPVVDSGRSPKGHAQRIDVIWQKDLVSTEDVVNRGQVLKGVAARAYLFGADGGHPLRIQGGISVTAYDTSDVSAGGEPRIVDQWRLPHDIVDRLGVKDQIGWGYNLFLPIAPSKLTPEVRRISLHLQYTPAKGETLLAAPATITLGLPPSLHTTRQMTPSAPQPAAVNPAPTPAPRWRM